MTKAKPGDKVKVHYTGKLTDGTVFDSSKDKEPLEFTLGEGKVIKGFDEGVAGMEEGEKQKIDIPCDDAYGEPKKELILPIKKDQFPENVNPKVGDQLQLQLENGQPVMVIVKEIQSDKILLDANHPLAGQDLKFELKLEEVN